MASQTPQVSAPKKASAFSELGLQQTVALLKQEIQDLYRSDDIPWIIGYSGGKDSTATLQLVWLAVRELPEDERKKPVHVISTDTLVENPIVAAWVTRSLDVMRKAAENDSLPFVPHRLTPSVEDSFWVNLIGKGYPAPRPKFRWCTERMKIRPSNGYIKSIVTSNGEAILLLGARKAESMARARVLKAAARYRVRDRLSPNPTMPGCLVYTPIEDWTNDDVWLFLMQIANPWGYPNKDLLTMYAGASADGECPLVVDTSTPSCGDSRFGCWVCTLVGKDKSMSAMVQNDQEKEWMLPLLKMRDAMDLDDDKHLRDFRRMSGAISLMHNGSPVPGPYTQCARESWLRQLLEAQSWIQSNGPEDVRDLQLITLDELDEIRRIWVIDKHELEDNLPHIYKEVTGREYPGRQLDDNLVIGESDMALLSELCGSDRIHYELTRELIDVERRHRNAVRRSEIFNDIEKAFKRGYYSNTSEAIAKVRKEQELLQRARDIRDNALTPLTEQKA